MSESILRRIKPDQIKARRTTGADMEATAKALEIVADVQKRGRKALLDYGLRFGDIQKDEKWIFDQSDFDEALASLPVDKRDLLRAMAKRIEGFAVSQRQCLTDLSTDIEGGKAGHLVTPVKRAACYAPGGRYPLPSSVLMTVIPAKVAGVETIWVASPRPEVEVLAACAVSGADHLLGIGGAQAIAAFAFGAGEIPACDVIVGPGNRFVTAAKRLVSGQVRIDMPAGPSELVVLADDTADPAWAAADMLAQAEHDPDALVILVALDESTAARACDQLALQLDDLPTSAVAREALKNAFSVIAPDIEKGIEICNRLAPEHLSVMVRDAKGVAKRLRNYGALFIGSQTAQALGDYGAGPNHVLPTGGSARSFGGLSVFNFLKVNTWIRIDERENAAELFHEATQMAEIEGLSGHANSLKLRLKR